MELMSSNTLHTFYSFPINLLLNRIFCSALNTVSVVGFSII